MKSIRKYLSGYRRGSAIVMAIVVMTVLLLLGLAVVTVSMGTLKSNVADASNNDAYYAAESAVQNAIEQVKYEVASYYNQMLTANSSDYAGLYADFFSGINSNARDHFSEPAFNGGITTETTFSMGTYDTTNDICEFLITSTATTADDARYQVNGWVKIKKVDVGANENWLSIDSVALKVGGTFTNSKGFAINNGNAVVGTFVNNRGNANYQGYSGNPVIVNPNVASTINDCVTFSGVSFSTPAMSSPDYYIIDNNTTLGSGSINTTKAVKIASASGISFTLGSGTSVYPGSVVYSRGNLSLLASTSSPGITCYTDGNFTSSGADKYATVYCGGNATISSAFTGTVYCKGNVTVSGNFKGTVYCNGDFIMPSGSFKGMVVCGGSSNITASGGIDASFFAGGSISISHGLQGDNHVVYAKDDISLSGGGSNNTVLFAGDDINLDNGPTVYGAVIAKGSVTQTGWFTINYSAAAVQAIMDDPDNTFFFGGSSGTPQLDENIFAGEDITAVGRL